MGDTDTTRSKLISATATPTNTPLVISGSTYSPVIGPSAALTESAIATAFQTTYTVVTTSEARFANGVSSTFVTVSAVTDPAVYSSISAAAAASTPSTQTNTESSNNASSSASASDKSSSNLSTLIPAVVVPVAVVLLVTFAAFWFYMRRRHRRDLNNQPAFVMAAKTEKLTSTTNSLASAHEDRELHIETWIASSASSHTTEKPLDFTQTRELSPRPSNSSPRSPPNFSHNDVGIARTSNVREEHRPMPLLPLTGADTFSSSTNHIANFAANTSPASNYKSEMIRSANPHLAPLKSYNSSTPGTQNISGRGPPAAVGTSNYASTGQFSKGLSNARGNRSNPNLNSSFQNGPQAPKRPPTAPSSGFRGPSPPRSFSPTHNRAAPPAPITAPSAANAATLSPGFINQPLYSPIIRDTPKAKRPSVIVPPAQNGGIAYIPHNSPLLPSPQSDSRRDHNLTAENLRIARLANTSRLGFGSPEPDSVSEISADHEAADAKSDVSSLNELEKFDFERGTRAGEAGSMLGNIPGGRSGESIHNHSPMMGSGQENPWRL